MTQTYSDPRAILRMRNGFCPECGEPVERHTNDNRFWMPRELDCDLMQVGVTERIARQHERDDAARLLEVANEDDVFPEWDAAAETADDARQGK